MREFLIDWLQGTVPSCYRKRLQGLVKSTFGGGFFSALNHGLKFYRQAYQHTCGVILGTDHRIPGSARDRDYLELSGRVLGLLSIHRLAWFFKGLRALDFSPTRIDLVLDDFSWSYTPQDVWDAYQAGNISGFRDTGKLIVKGRDATKGLSCTFGNRGRAGSGKRLTFYDKNKESNGSRNCCRLELSFYGDYAAQCFGDLSMSLSHWPLLFASYISKAVDFIDRSVSGRADRCPRLPWWDNLIGQVIPLCWEPRFVNPELLDRIQNWLVKQVSPSFSAIFEIFVYRFGENSFWEFFYSLLFDGESRQNDQLKSLVLKYKVLAST
jgi:hypothetical protein